MGGRQKGSAVHGGGLFSIKREEEKGLEGLLYLHHPSPSLLLVPSAHKKHAEEKKVEG